MKGIIFFFGIVISVIVSVFVVLPEVSARTIIPEGIVIDAVTRQTVLNATIKITFLAPATDEYGQPVVNIVNGERQVAYTGGTGLGTVVSHNGETIIVTHDHWKLIDNPQAFVELANAQGAVLDTMSGPEFGTLIRYRDGGTTIFTMPDSLAGYFTPVSGNVSATVNRSDVLAIAYRNQDDSVSVVATVVSDLSKVEGLDMVEMTSVDGQIIYTGNSGGGVFAGGQLVANMWATILTQDNGTDDVNHTERSRAALLPVAF